MTKEKILTEGYGVKMNNTDLKFNEEYKRVQENVKKLVIGNKYKYAELMELLELPIKRGKGKTNQINRIKEYIQWDSKTKIYNGIIKDAEPVTKKTTSSEYYELVKDCFLTNLHEYIKRNPTKNRLNLSYNKALLMCDIVSDGYMLTNSKHGVEIASELLEIDTLSISTYREKLRSDGISILESTLNQMMKADLIYYEKGITFVKFKRDVHGHPIKILNERGALVNEATYTRATMEEMEALMECKAVILEEMLPDIKPANRMYVLKATGKYDKYYKRVLDKLSDYGINIDNFFNGYDILLNKTNTNYNTESFLQSMDLKNKMSLKMLETKDKYYRNILYYECFSNEAYENKINKISNVMIDNDYEFNNSLEGKLSKAEITDNIDELKQRVKVVESSKAISVIEYDAYLDKLNNMIKELYTQISA